MATRASSSPSVVNSPASGQRSSPGFVGWPKLGQNSLRILAGVSCSAEARPEIPTGVSDAGGDPDRG